MLPREHAENGGVRLVVTLHSDYDRALVRRRIVDYNNMHGKTKRNS